MSKNEQTTKTAKKAPAPNYRYIDIASLDVDRGYQRDLDDRIVNHIVGNYNPELMHPVDVVSRGNCKYYALDGQHRIAAHRALGLDKVYCRILPSRTESDEARLFLGLNGDLDGKRHAVAAFSKFRARLKANEPIALEIADVVKRAGLRLTPHKASHGVTAVQALEWVHTRHTNLERTLMILTMWQDGDAGAYDNGFIRHVSGFLAVHEDAVDSQTVSVLREVSTEELKKKIKATKADFGGTLSEAATRTIRALYNARCKGRMRRLKVQG